MENDAEDRMRWAFHKLVICRNGNIERNAAGQYRTHKTREMWHAFKAGWAHAQSTGVSSDEH